MEIFHLVGGPRLGERSAGKVFPNGIGVDLQWGTQDRSEEFATRDDDVLILNLSWQFGAPPRRATITGAE